MSWSLKAHIAASGQTTFSTPGPGIDTTGADLIVIVATGYVGSLTTLSDSKSNSWLTAVSNTSGVEPYSIIYYLHNPTVGTGHTFTLTGTGNIFATLEVVAFSGSAASPLDQTNSATSNNITSIQPGSITPTTSGQLIITGLSHTIAATDSINSGFTIEDQIAYNGGVNESGALGYLIQGAAAAVNPTWSWTSAPADGVATIASFKASAATLQIIDQPLPIEILATTHQVFNRRLPIEIWALPPITTKIIRRGKRRRALLAPNILVTSDSPVILEWFKSQRLDSITPTEWRASQPVDKGISAEWLGMRGADSNGIFLEWLVSTFASVFVDAGSSLEWKGGIQANPNVCLEWYGQLGFDRIFLDEILASPKSADSALILEWSASSQQAGRASFEWLRAAQQANSNSPIEWLGTFQQISRASTQAEWLTSQQADESLLFDQLATQRACRVLLEWSASQRADGTSLTEWLMAQRAEGTLLEWLGAQKSDGMFFEWLVNQRTENGALIEWLAGQNQNQNANLNLLIEWFGPVAIINHAIAPVEWFAMQRLDGTSLLEWMATQRADPSFFTEWIRMARVAEMMIWLEGLAVAQKSDNAAPLEWLAAQRADGVLLEWLIAARSSDRTIPAEWVISAYIQEAGVPIEILATNFTRISDTLTEWVNVIKTVATDDALPMEVLSAKYQDIVLLTELKNVLQAILNRPHLLGEENKPWLISAEIGP